MGLPVVSARACVRTKRIKSQFYKAVIWMTLTAALYEIYVNMVSFMVMYIVAKREGGEVVCY